MRGSTLERQMRSGNAGGRGPCSRSFWKAFFEIGGVALLAATFIFGAGALIVNNRINVVESRELADFKLKFEGEQQKTAHAQQEAAEAKALAGGFERDIATANKGAAEANERAVRAQASLALAEQHAAEANTKAEAFRLDIAKANQASSEAQAQVASASAEAARANLELAKLKTPRNLNLEQQGRVSGAIGQFSGTPYDLWVSTDSDSAALMDEIDAALRAAKWEFHASGVIQFGGKAGIISSSGVSLHIPVEKTAELGQPAMALAAALRAEGIPQETVYSDGPDFNKDFDRTRIHIWVGSKPLN